jgi:hypothetical protein
MKSLFGALFMRHEFDKSDRRGARDFRAPYREAHSFATPWPMRKSIEGSFSFRSMVLQILHHLCAIE